MKRINKRTVELTPPEIQVREEFEDLTAKGFGIEGAARQALKSHVTWVEQNFVEYLSDGTLTLHHGDLISVQAKSVIGDRTLAEHIAEKAPQPVQPEPRRQRSYRDRKPL